MFVCLCKGITDSDIQKLVLEHGVGSIRELKQHVALGSECGSCTKVAQMVIDNTIIDETLFKDVGYSNVIFKSIPSRYKSNCKSLSLLTRCFH